MFGVALTPGLLVGTATAGTLELTGSVRLLAIVVGLLAAVATMVGVIYGAKWKAAHAVEKALNEALAERVNLVVHERDEARAKLENATTVLVDAQSTIARLEGLPNLERVLVLVSDTFTRFADRFADLLDDHEKNAERRHQALIAESRKPD